MLRVAQASRKLALLSNETRAAALRHRGRARKRIRIDSSQPTRKTVPLRKSSYPPEKWSPALFSRLRMKENGIAEMSSRVREVANLPDPLGKRLAATELDRLILLKESCR